MMKLPNSNNLHNIKAKAIQLSYSQFFQLLGKPEPLLTEERYKKFRDIVFDSNLTTIEDFNKFLVWATTENANEGDGRLDSVRYLAIANDPVFTLNKNLQNLLRIFNANQKSKSALQKKDVRHPSYTTVYGLMLGPGINRPLKGWTSARQKLNAIKYSWYGDGFESYPDPPDFSEELLQKLFEQYQTKRSIKK